MSSSRTVWWVSSVLYAAVLLSGLYYELGPLDAPRPVLPSSLVVFVLGVASLLALDAAERRRYPLRTPRGQAAALLCLRLALIITVVAFDGSGLSRILLVLVPFTAYFAFGRRVSVMLAAACVVVVLAVYWWTVPRWYADIEYISDLLMFCAGLVLAVAMAAVASGEQEGRRRLEESNARLAAYAAQVAELSATTERLRLARDIHDGLGHHLTAVAVLLEKASAFSERDPAQAGQALDDARTSTRHALEDVRRSVGALRTREREPFSLSAALTDLVRAPDGGRPVVGLEVTGDETACDTPVRAALFRAAQEALTNARRHAGAGRVTIGLSFGEFAAELVVADDGRGFVAGREGFGLVGMRERIELVGGHVDMTGGPGAGTRVTVTVPYRAAATPGPAS